MSPWDPHRTGADQARLEALIEEGLAPHTDSAEVEARIWELYGERWSIMFTDLAGFSRRAAEHGIVHFLQVIHVSRRMLVPVIEEHDGVLLKLEADSMLAMFREPDRAMTCSLRMQTLLDDYNADRHPREQVLLCVGLGHGDVLRIGDHEIWGTPVNAASRLGEDCARAREILITHSFHEAVKDTAGLGFTPIDVVPAGEAGAFRVEVQGES